MASYEFVQRFSGGRVYLRLRIDMKHIGQVSQSLLADGYQRLFDSPSLHIYWPDDEGYDRVIRACGSTWEEERRLGFA